MNGGISFRLAWQVTVRDEPRLPAFDKHLALTLATFMDPAGYCYPGVKRIAFSMSVTRRSVQMHLHGEHAKLIELGYLVLSSGGGRGKTHGFQAQLPLGEQRRFVNADSSDGNGEPDDTKGASENGNGDRRSPEPVTDFVNEPAIKNTHAEAAYAHLETEDDIDRLEVVERLHEDVLPLLPDADDRTIVTWAQIARAEHPIDPGVATFIATKITGAAPDLTQIPARAGYVTRMLQSFAAGRATMPARFAEWKQ